MRRSISTAAVLAAVISLGGCVTDNTPAPAPAATISVAQNAVVTFCTTDLTAVQALGSTLNSQLQADLATASRVCGDINNGASVNWISASVAVWDLYEGLHTVYPNVVKLKPYHVAALRRAVLH